MNRFLKSALRVLLATGIAAISASPALAASFTVFGTGGSTRGTCTVERGSTGSAPQVFSGSCAGDSTGRSNGQARADFGNIGVRAYAESNNSVAGASWNSAASFSDTLMFTSSDPSVRSALVSANFILEGVMDGFALGGQGLLEGVIALGNSTFFFRINPSGSTPLDLGGLTVIDGMVSGAFNLPTDALLRTPLVNVGVGSPVRFSISLDGATSLLGAGGFTNTGLVDFGNSFQVPIGSNAFVLPDGITVNSGDWLVNNRRIVPGMGAVPEPASWALMILGFGFVGAAMRQRGSVRFAAA
jgi:hypothetical protein